MGIVYAGELASFSIAAFAALNVVFVIGWLATVVMAAAALVMIASWFF